MREVTKEEIFNYFYTNSANLSIRMTGFIMLAGLAIGAIIWLTYFFNYRGVAYNAKFNASLVIILLISVVIMLMISSNIVISLGMVGALSIVRFRTAIKDSRDTVFIFWAIAEGLSVGSQNFKLALITTLFIAIVISIFGILPNFSRKYMLVICGEEKIDLESFQSVLNDIAKYNVLRSANKDAAHQEMIYEIKLKGEMDVTYIDKLTEVKGVKSVNWVAESGENVG